MRKLGFELLFIYNEFGKRGKLFNEIRFMTFKSHSEEQPEICNFQISKTYLHKKGVFSKPSGKCIVAPNLCFLS